MYVYVPFQETCIYIFVCVTCKYMQMQLNVKQWCECLGMNVCWRNHVRSSWEKQTRQWTVLQNRSSKDLSLAWQPRMQAILQAAHMCKLKSYDCFSMSRWMSGVSTCRRNNTSQHESLLLSQGDKKSYDSGAQIWEMPQFSHGLVACSFGKYNTGNDSISISGHYWKAFKRVAP